MISCTKTVLFTCFRNIPKPNFVFPSRSLVLKRLELYGVYLKSNLLPSLPDCLEVLVLSKVKADSDLEPSPVPLRYLEVAYCSSKTLSRVINGFVAGIRELYFSFAESSSRWSTTPITDCRRVEEFNLTCRHNDKDQVNRMLEQLLTSGANLRRLVSYSADERSVILLRRFKNIQQLALVSYHNAPFR